MRAIPIATISIFSAVQINSDRTIEETGRMNVGGAAAASVTVLVDKEV